LARRSLHIHLPAIAGPAGPTATAQNQAPIDTPTAYGEVGPMRLDFLHQPQRIVHRIDALRAAVGAAILHHMAFGEQPVLQPRLQGDAAMVGRDRDGLVGQDHSWILTRLRGLGQFAV